MPDMTCPGMPAIQVAHENIILIMAHCSKYFKYFLFIRGGGFIPALFRKLEKRALFWEKYPDCGHLRVKFLI